jgi:hypothetical protein
MTRKQKITISPRQKLEYAKLMVEEIYTYKQIKRCPVLVRQLLLGDRGNINWSCQDIHRKVYQP